MRAKRDATQPADLGLVEHGRRRAPGLRRSELAARAQISVEYLTRIEQGRDRNPTGAVINAIADALSLDARERRHLAYLAKITGGACATHAEPEPPTRQVRPSVRRTLELIEPGIAMLTNRLGDILAYTDRFERVLRPTGLLDTDEPNLTRYVFTDRRARDVFPEWGQVADEQAFNLWLGPSAGASEWFKTEVAPLAGPEFTSRLDQHLPPDRLPLRVRVRGELEFRFDRETLELPDPDAQQMVIFLPADQHTAQAVGRLQSDGVSLRAI
jgi:transcriptional regulator with XRE-family HTH domain